MMTRAVETFIPLQFGSVRCLTAGEGRPLVYLHGVGDAGTLLPVFADAAARRHVIRPDHPGFLWSDSGPFASVRELAAWYPTLLDIVGIEAADIVGCSLGGWVAAELALAAPERCASLTLIDPAGMAGDVAPPDAFTLSPEETVRRTFATKRLRSSPAPPSETIAALARSRETARRWASSPYMHDPGLFERLAAVSMEVDVVWGDSDGILPPESAECWRRAIPHARVTVIENAGHLPQLEQPERFLDAVRFVR